MKTLWMLSAVFAAGLLVYQVMRQSVGWAVLDAGWLVLSILQFTRVKEE